MRARVCVSSPLFRKQLLSAQRFGAKKGRVWAIQLFPSFGKAESGGHALFVLPRTHRNKKRVIKFALRHWDCENSRRERENNPTKRGRKIKVNGKRSTINFQSLTGNGHESWHFCTHPTGQTKQGMCGVGVDAISPPSNYRTSASRSLGKHILICLRMASTSKFIEPQAEREKALCRFGTHKQIRIMPLS